MWIGPVGLAETNSRFTERPAIASPSPYDSPAATIWPTSAAAAAVSRVMFRKPGPAMSTAAIPAVPVRCLLITPAISRGGRPAILASFKATGVA